MNLHDHVPRLNNAWVNLKHRFAHWRKRRNRTVPFETVVGDPRNVLVVVVDCLRADHVSEFGHDRETTPTLDDIDAAAFSNAKAPSPWTFPSVPSLLSGRYPHEHGGCFTTDPRNLSAEQFPRRPRSDVPTLPDMLETAGYDTGMITAIPMAEKSVGDRFRYVNVRYSDANERVQRAREWIAGRDRWFCYLHLGDAHAPLDVSNEHRRMFDVPPMEDIDDWRFRQTTEGDDFDAYRDARLRAYDAAIRGVDDALSGLFEELSEDVVVVCGDHGEAFWEHPELERRLNDDPRGYYATDHGHSVLEEVARVPLWIRAPRVRPKTSDDPVSLIDVVPTILRALDADVPGTATGVHLEDESDDRSLLCEEIAYGHNQRAVWNDGQKAISVPSTGRTIAFEMDGYLEGDPLPHVPDHFETALSSFESDVSGRERIDVSASTKNQLEELGYL